MSRSRKTKRTLKKHQTKLTKRSQSPETAALTIYDQLAKVQKELDAFTENFQKLDERMQDAEIHINLLTRLFTTICIEKLGMRVGVLKRLLKRIEKEAIRDSQIMHLESIYNLPHPTDKKAAPQPPRKDPWEDIS